MERTMFYYDVTIGAKRHWESASFSYSSVQEVPLRSIVSVPFGRQTKPGVVVRRVDKPAFAVKPLRTYGDLHMSEPTVQFMDWFTRYYAAQPGQAAGQFLPQYLTKKLPKDLTDSNESEKKLTLDFSPAPELSSAQEHARRQLQKNSSPAVLHGVTGAGKTRLYITMLQEALKNGQSGLLLYPEISLTPQLVEELRRHLPLLVFHSGLSAAARSKLWFTVAMSTEPVVVLGPRSALFVPHRNLGIIIIDEAHESTYKQETDIRYNSLLTAGGLAQAHNAKLVIASATPPLTETELVHQRGGDVVCLHERAIKSKHGKQVHVIDRKDRSQFTRHNLLSNSLLGAIETGLSSGMQSLLFINRRGTAKITLCEHCGWQAECPDCELPLTFHHDVHKLVCHTCGKTERVPTVCPDCSKPTSVKSLGSKAIVDEVQRLFPQARIGRFDSDTNKQESFGQLYDQVKSGAIDILVGTQQIAKGLDLPKLTTVGVLNADLSLQFPDYSSDERTFQLLSQVIGRAGRGHQPGQVYVQTLHPNNDVIQVATREDWHTFRTRELASRKAHNFPPYIFAAKVVFRHKKAETANEQAAAAKQTLSGQIGITIDGPLPSFHYKRSGYFYIQLHIKSRSRAQLLTALKQLDGTALYDLDPVSFL